jgi:thioesterase domain-containing protein
LGHQIRVFAAHINIVYRPKAPLRGQAYLLQTTDVDLEDEDAMSPEEAAERWKSFAPSMQVISAAGNHLTMLESPFVEAIAERARRIWERG